MGANDSNLKMSKKDSVKARKISLTSEKSYSSKRDKTNGSVERHHGS